LVYPQMAAAWIARVVSSHLLLVVQGSIPLCRPNDSKR